MTEYEHAILFVEFAQTASAAMANYITLVFAMIVASHLAARRLDRWLAAIAIFIYSLFALGFCNEIFQIYSDFSRLGIQIEANFGSLSTTDLGWLGPVKMGAGFLSFLPSLIAIMTLLAYAASVWFFFRSRKQNKAEEAATPPVTPAL